MRSVFGQRKNGMDAIFRNLIEIRGLRAFRIERTF